MNVPLKNPKRNKIHQIKSTHDKEKNIGSRQNQANTKTAQSK